MTICILCISDLHVVKLTVYSNFAASSGTFCRFYTDQESIGAFGGSAAAEPGSLPTTAVGVQKGHGRARTQGQLEGNHGERS